MLFDLSGKKALITGATGGIGEAVTKAFIGQNCEIVGSGRNKTKFQNSFPNHHFIECDLANIEDVEGLFDKAEALVGQIDILVCNAGLTRDNISLRMKNEEWDDVLNVNLKSTFILNRNAIKKMIRRKYGRIINISSIVAFSGNPGQANYVASKAGMVGMTKSFAIEVASRGITVNNIAPGFISTQMTEILNDEQKKAINDKIPAGKIGDPRDIAAAGIYLASAEASYITGQTIHVNGGMYM